MCDISNNHSLNPANPHTSHWAKVNQRRSHLQKLEDDITSLAAHIDAAMFRWLELIREFDECEGWAGDGIRSCAHWLNWKCGLGLGAARERVRVANVLKDLPKICEAFRQGRVSYSKVRAMTRVATTQNEDVLLDIARHGTAWHVERVVSVWRREKRMEALSQENHRHDLRELSWLYDDDGCLVPCHTPYDTFRAPQNCQDKARFAGNGYFLAKECNAVLAVLRGSLRQGEKRPSAVLHSLELDQPVLHSRALQLTASRLAESVIWCVTGH